MLADVTRTSSKAGLIETISLSVYLSVSIALLVCLSVFSACLMFISCLTHYSWLCLRSVSVCFTLYTLMNLPLFLHYLSIWSLLTSLSTSLKFFSPQYSWRCFNEGFHLLSTFPSAPLELVPFSVTNSRLCGTHRGFLFITFPYTSDFFLMTQIRCLMLELYQNSINTRMSISFRSFTLDCRECHFFPVFCWCFRKKGLNIVIF